MVDNRSKSELLSEISDLKKELDNRKKFENCKNCADDTAMIFQSFMDAGFTRTESMKILISLINANVK